MSIVPIFEPEVIAAGARKRHGDDEKIATTSLKEMRVDGIKIVSRYGKANEFQMLSDIVGYLPLDACSLIAEVFCDSKAGWSIEIRLHQWNANSAEWIGFLFGRMMLAENGGHNGILVSGGHQRCSIEPSWRDTVLPSSIGGPS